MAIQKRTIGYGQCKKTGENRFSSEFNFAFFWNIFGNILKKSFIFVA
jgi:hypothetical protein